MIKSQVDHSPCIAMVPNIVGQNKPTTERTQLSQDPGNNQIKGITTKGTKKPKRPKPINIFRINNGTKIISDSSVSAIKF